MKKIGLFFATVIMMTFFAFSASAEKEGYYTYTVNNGESTITDVLYLIGDVVIPDTLGGYPVTAIGDSVFAYFSHLESVIIPDSVTSIGDRSFLGCTNLKNVIIPDGVTSIGDIAFGGCVELESVVIPDSVRSIGDDAFGSCGLKSVVIPDGVTSIGDSAFSNCTNLESVIIPEGVTSISERLFYECTNLKSITIPVGVTSIGDIAFFGCTNLESVIIPDGITSMGDAAFRGCTKLESIEIPDTVNYIGDFLLYDTAYYNNKDNWSDGLLINNGCLLEVYTDYVYISADIRLVSGECFDNDLPIVKYFEVDSDNKYFSSDEYGVLYNKDKTELICYPIASKNKSYIIPDTVETVNSLCSFYLETLVIPESVKNFLKDRFGFGDRWCYFNYSFKDVYIYSDNLEIKPDCLMCFNNIDQEKWFEIRDELLKILEECISQIINGTITEEIMLQYESMMSEIYIDEYVPYGTIHANVGSTAEDYALEKGISFEVLKDDITVTDEKTGVTADYTDGIFAAEPDFVITENGKNADVIFTDIYGKFTSYDISFEINGEKVQPNGKVTVRIPLPEGYSMESTVVCYVDDSGNITYLDSEYVNGYIVFETDHFSEYVLIDKSSEIKDEPSTEPDEPDTPDCSCNCHKGGISGFIWKILRFFYKLFKINPTCACGVAHY